MPDNNIGHDTYDDSDDAEGDKHSQFDARDSVGDDDRNSDWAPFTSSEVSAFAFGDGMIGC